MQQEVKIDQGLNIFKNASHQEEGQTAMMTQWTAYMIQVRMTRTRIAQNAGEKHHQKRHNENL
jgi:hypothetical protein